MKKTRPIRLFIASVLILVSLLSYFGCGPILEPESALATAESSVAPLTPHITPTPARRDDPTPTPSVPPRPSATPQITATPIAPQFSETGYRSAYVDFDITTEKIDKSVYYIVDISIKDMRCLRAAFAKGQFGKKYRERPTVMARDNDALLAISGDYCGYRDDGIIIRNGEIYRNKPKRDMAAIFSNGEMRIFPEAEYPGDSVQALLDEGLLHTFSFGPALIRDGVVCDFSRERLRGANPRAGIGYISPGHFVFMVVDGRKASYSVGVTLDVFARAFEKLGCTQAYNLDGGGSAAMVFNGEPLNRPQGTDRQRAISDILYIAPMEKL